MAKQQLYHIGYKNLKFGTEDEYLPEVHEMKVVTAGGIKDAIAACKQYHPRCKIVQSLDHLAYLAQDGKLKDATV
ncbi:MAG: hypothetical protein J5614_06615 [Paludibacteraceae bacterium]|nr:hypothetical protein [Paludibacteraceae bacterium]